MRTDGERGSFLNLTSKKNKDSIIDNIDYLMKVPPSHELISPLLNILPLQLLSYHIAAHRGLDVDQPRNLAKSVTVE